jgi:hypothetical protein
MYPALFREKLGPNKALRGVVDHAVSELEEWLNVSRVPFFPEYTDHGVAHIQDTINTAAALVPPKAAELISDADAALLVLATLYHDLAMHLTEDGFRQLVRGDAAKWPCTDLDSLSWPSVWDQYLVAVDHWSDRDALDLLGIALGTWPSRVRNPLTSLGNLSELDRRLIGEFIRQNHGRLDHDMALHGILGPNRPFSNPLQTLDEDQRDLCGLIARSHAMPVRGCLDYLKERHWSREYRGVHAVYLMSLLRLADYLQVEGDRAPASSFKYRRLTSRRSELEWRVHGAVKSISVEEDDPEELYVVAEPPDVRTFLRLQEWSRGLQMELDACWAVLGEAYGRHERLRDLGVTFRRVRTSIDNSMELARRVSYVPRRVQFGLSEPETLKLLVRPLYGDDMSVGIRELVQNAVDAVRERDFHEGRLDSKTKSTKPTDPPDVELAIDGPDEDGVSWLRVTDQGIGMTEETICRYFLTAGASIRHDPAWRAEFEVSGAKGEQQDKPRTKVLRTGRFGIGVLAAFLLGDRIEVRTRYVSASRGMRFTTELDEDLIELTCDNTIPIGTTIRVLLSSTVARRLGPFGSQPSHASEVVTDWFCLDYPRVVNHIGAKRASASGPAHKISLRDLPASPLWRKVYELADVDVYWSFAEHRPLSVNGIIILGRLRDWGWRSPPSFHRALIPGVDLPTSICILDPDGVVPLTLRRDDLTEEGDAKLDSIGESVYRDYMAYLLVNVPEQPSLSECFSLERHRGVSEYWGMPGFRASAPWLCSRTGLGPCAQWALAYGSAASVCAIVDADINAGVFNTFQHDVYVRHNWYRTPDLTELFVMMREHFRYTRAWRKRSWPGCELSGFRVVCSEDVAAAIAPVSDPWPDPVSNLAVWESGRTSQMRDELRREVQRGHLCQVATVGCPPTLFDVEGLAHVLESLSAQRTGSRILAIEYFLVKKPDGTKTTTMPVLWAKLIGSPEIPYDPERRRVLISNAARELAPYIAANETALSARRASEECSKGGRGSRRGGEEA